MDGHSLYKTDQGSVSDQSTEAYLFPVRSNEYYIDFTPEGNITYILWIFCKVRQDFL